MAKLSSGRNFKDKRNIVGLTICSLPAWRAPDGTLISSRRRVEFASTVRCLKPLPGYMFFVAGRGVDNPDEVLMCTYWVNQESLRDFLQSPDYTKYLESLGLDNTEQNDGDLDPTTAVAEVRPRFLPSGNLATIFTAAFPLSIEPDTARLESLRLLVPDSIHHPGRLGPPRPERPGWIIDPQLEDGRLVKKGMVVKGMVVQLWAVLEPFEKQLEIYRAVKQDAESRESWKRQVEELRALSVSVKQTTWDFGSSSDSYDSGSETDQEIELAEELGRMKVHN